MISDPYLVWHLWQLSQLETNITYNSYFFYMNFLVFFFWGILLDTKFYITEWFEKQGYVPLSCSLATSFKLSSETADLNMCNTSTLMYMYFNSTGKLTALQLEKRFFFKNWPLSLVVSKFLKYSHKKLPPKCPV